MSWLYSPLLSAGFTLPVDAATLTLTPRTLTFNASLGVTKGDLTETGQAIGFAQTMSVGNGTLTLTGQDLTLIANVSYTLAVDAAALSLVGQEVGLTLADTARPLGLSPWRDFARPEEDDARKSRVQRDRERMGIVEPTPEPTTAPDRPSRSKPATRPVLQLDAARQRKAERDAEAERIAYERVVLQALEAMEAERLENVRQLDIRRRVALILIAAEA